MIPQSEQPGYYPTVRYIYEHIEFHISEDEAYAVLDAFIGFWNERSGQLVLEQDFKDVVVDQLRWSMLGSLGEVKIHRIVDLILEFLKKEGHYQVAA